MKILRIALRASLPAILCALVSGAPLPAQTEPISEATIPAVPVINDSAQNPSQALVNSSAPAPETPVTPTGRLPWLDSLFNQKLPIELGFRVGEEHSDNIFYQQKKTDDYITEVSATLGVTFGTPIALAPALDQETADEQKNEGDISYFHVGVTPTLILYARNSGLDDVDEDVDVIYTHQFSRLTLSLEQSYEKLSQPTVQINAQGTLIHRDVYTTTARANYIYSDQLSTYGTLTQTVNSYLSGQYTDNTEWQADYYFLYQLFPKLSVGAGPRVGWEDIIGAPNQDFQSVLVHAAYAYSGKFHVAGAAGAEVREFQNNAAPEKVTPIVEGIATYQPFDSMQITLDGERHRFVSNGQPGTDYTASVAALSVRQRFFQVAYLTLGAGYEDDQYTGFAGGGGGGLARDDQISYLRGKIEWTSFRGITIDASYQYLQDHSTIKAFTFDESRATISASFKY